MCAGEECGVRVNVRVRVRIAVYIRIRVQKLIHVQLGRLHPDMWLGGEQDKEF